MPKKPTRREWGTGSITWLSPSKALLRIPTSDGVRSKTVRLAHRDHRGRGQAEEELAKFEAELNAVEDSPAGETLESVLSYYIDHVTRLDKRRGTIETYGAVAKRTE